MNKTIKVITILGAVSLMSACGNSRKGAPLTAPDLRTTGVAGASTTASCAISFNNVLTYCEEYSLKAGTPATRLDTFKGYCQPYGYNSGNAQVWSQPSACPTASRIRGYCLYDDSTETQIEYYYGATDVNTAKSECENTIKGKFMNQ